MSTDRGMNELDRRTSSGGTCSGGAERVNCVIENLFDKVDR